MSPFPSFVILAHLEILNFLNKPESQKYNFGLIRHIADDDNIATLFTAVLLANEKQATIPPKHSAVCGVNFVNTFLTLLLQRCVRSLRSYFPHSYC
jgi:hypothetical protein